MSTLQHQLKDCKVGDCCPLRLSASTRDVIRIAMPLDPKCTTEDLKKAGKQGLVPTQSHTDMATEEWVFKRAKQVDDPWHEWVWLRVA